MPLKQHHGKDRPFGGRRNKEARNQALTEAREVMYTIRSYCNVMYSRILYLEVLHHRMDKY